MYCVLYCQNVTRYDLLDFRQGKRNSLFPHYTQTTGLEICPTGIVVGQHFQQSMDQPGMVVSPTRGQLNRAENEFSLFPFMPENLISRDRFGRLVPR